MKSHWMTPVLAASITCALAVSCGGASRAISPQEPSGGEYYGGYYEADASKTSTAYGDMPSPVMAGGYAEGEYAGYSGSYDDGANYYADLGTKGKDMSVPASGATAAGPVSSGEPALTTSLDASASTPDRLILYTAEMGIAVFRVDEKLDEISKLVKEWKGYMVSMDTTSIVFRVPAARFDEALEAIDKLGDVTYRSVQGTDVTDEFRDLQIRLANAIAVRDRLLELLSQAKNVNESLTVEHELERITEEIELMKGRMKYIQEAASYSRIAVYLSVKTKTKKPLPPLYAPFQWIQDIGLDQLFSF